MGNDCLDSCSELFTRSWLKRQRAAIASRRPAKPLGASLPRMCVEAIARLLTTTARWTDQLASSALSQLGRSLTPSLERMPLIRAVQVRIDAPVSARSYADRAMKPSSEMRLIPKSARGGNIRDRFTS